MSIRSGRYIIINGQHRNTAFLSDSNDGTYLVGHHEYGVVGDEWTVRRFPNGGYSIANFVHKMSASAGYRPQRGASVVGRGRDQIWLIKEHGSGGKYTIATTNDELRWCLEDGWSETPALLALGKITLHNAPPSDPRCQWIFEEIGRLDTVPYEAAKEKAAAAKAEVARKVEELKEVKREAAAARREAADEATKRKDGEAELARKVEEVKQARQEAAAARRKAADEATRREEAELEVSRKVVELEEVKKEAAQARAEVARNLAEMEAARAAVESIEKAVQAKTPAHAAEPVKETEAASAATERKKEKRPRRLSIKLAGIFTPKDSKKEEPAPVAPAD